MPKFVAWNFYSTFHTIIKKMISLRTCSQETTITTKEKIQEDFKKKLELLVDIVKHGSGLTNDENTARFFFF